MRYCWVDGNNSPDYNKGDKSEIDGWFMPMFDARTTKMQMSDIKVHNYARGIYLGHNWLSGTPESVRDKVVSEYNRVYVDGLRIQLNFEQKEPDWIVAVFEGVRAKLLNVGLSWAFEGMQGGWIGAAQTSIKFVARLLQARIRFVPEAFYGAEGRIDGYWSELAISRDLTRIGIPDSSISPFYDGRNLMRGAQGYVFTMGRLPT